MVAVVSHASPSLTTGDDQPAPGTATFQRTFCCSLQVSGTAARSTRLSRFGPLFNIEKMGGQFCLCAMKVPADRFDEVVDRVNALPQVAHNYERDHELNMWFVLATESEDGIAQAAAEIEQATGIEVYRFPKLEEFYVGLKFDV